MLKCNQIWQNFAILANFKSSEMFKALANFELNANWQILIVVNGQMLKNNLAIRSHCWAA